MALAYEPMALELDLPWQVDEQREKAFKDMLKRILIPLLLLFIIVPFLPKVDLDYITDQDLPVRTQILLDPIVEPEPEPVPQPKEKPKPVAPAPAAQPQSTAQSPRENELKKSVSESQGLSELSRQLNAARSSVNVASMKKKNLSETDGGKVAAAERSRLGEDLTTRSSSTVVNDTVMQGEMTELSAHQSAAVEGLVTSDSPSGGQKSHLSNRVGQRDMESIRRTLEQAKGNVYALYQRALQENPGLTGEFTFELVIEPNGSISNLTLLVSELGVAELERNIIARIKTVDFGAKDVPPTVVEYRFVFLPS